MSEATPANAPPITPFSRAAFTWHSALKCLAIWEVDRAFRGTSDAYPIDYWAWNAPDQSLGPPQSRQRAQPSLPPGFQVPHAARALGGKSPTRERTRTGVSSAFLLSSPPTLTNLALSPSVPPSTLPLFYAKACLWLIQSEETGCSQLITP